MAEGTGFITRPGMVVNEIKNLLKGRYKRGFPVIKEIIQNANDGRATYLDFGVMRGLGNQVNHPLLKCPALFFLNNGVFTRTDQEAITWFAVDANAGDKSKIGKFGLGQKSVFHFCEAFFYIARSEDIPTGCGRLLNPWAPPTGVDPKRPEWVSLSDSDRHSLEQYMIAQGLLQKHNPHYFLLWVPLRQEASDRRYILSDLYDADTVQADLPQDMDLQIAQLLPSLRHLLQVQYWVQRNDNTLEKKFQICLQPLELQPLERCRYPKNKQENEQESLVEGPHSLKGKTLISPGNLQLQFGGREQLLPSSQFTGLLANNNHYHHEEFWSALEQSDYWAKRRSVDENRDEHDEPDKVLPHCAALFTCRKRNASNRSTFTLQWAVFLPLAGREQQNQEEFFECTCEGDNDYTLLLHGYFFLDSGRQYIEALHDILNGLSPKLPDSEEEMNRQWNRILATQGTLRLILPALKTFVESHQLRSSDISNLCTALKKSIFSKKFNLQHLCAEHQWFHRLHPEKSEWMLLDKHSRLRSLPATPPSWSAFPALKQVAEQDYLTLADAPNLRIEQSTDRWTIAEVTQVFASRDAKTVFSSPQCLLYLAEFLKSTKAVQASDVQDKLYEVVNQGFREIGTQSLQQAKFLKSVRACIELLAPERRFKLKKPQGIGDEEISRILQKIFALNLSCLLVYEPFEPNDEECRSSDRIDDHSAALLLRYFEQLLQQSSEKDQQIADSFVEQILTPDSARRLLSANSDLQIIRGYDCLHRQCQTYSCAELAQLHQDGSLFSAPGKSLLPDELARALQDAVSDRPIVLINSSKASLLTKVPTLKTITRCDHEGCRKLLRACPNLADSCYRIILLKQLLSTRATKELRYLLHANKTKYDDVSTLFSIASESQPASLSSQAWKKIGKQALAKSDGSWRLIDQVLTNQIPPDMQSNLGIVSLTAEKVVEVIEADFENQGADCLDTSSWSDVEYDNLLLQLYDSDKQVLWRELRLHKTENNQRVSLIEGRTYLMDLKSSFSCSRHLTALVTLIQLNSDPKIQKAQRDWIQPWTFQTALNVMLSQPSPQQYCNLILETLEQVIPHWKSLPLQEVEMLEQQLRETAWLSTKLDSQGLSPESIVRLPQNLVRYESSILALQSGYSETALDSSIRNHKIAYRWVSEQFKAYSSIDVLSLILETI